MSDGHFDPLDPRDPLDPFDPRNSRFTWFRQVRSQIRHRCGSLSLFFCVLLAALVTVMGAWLQAARIRSYEADIARCLSAQVQVGLASYDRDLLDQFGLFGFKNLTPDQTIIEGMLPSLAGADNCVITVRAEHPLYDRTELKAQLLMHMKARVPAIYLDVLAERLSQFAQCLPGSKTSLPATKSFSLTAMKPGLPNPDGGLAEGTATFSNPAGGLVEGSAAFSNPTGGLAEVLQDILPDLSKEMVRGLAESLFGDLIDKLEDDLLRSVRETYRRYATDWMGIGQDDALTDILGEMPDFLNPQSLTALGSRIDQLMTFATPPIYDKFCIMEYALGYFVPRVTMRSENGASVPLLTLDGRSMPDLPDGRASEVECLITGLKDAHVASLVVRMAIISMRSFLQLVALMLDETRLAALRTAATSIAAAIAAISVGTVLFDPELLTWVLAVGEALKAGYQDSQRLIDGKSVPVWPGKPKINMNVWYQDYLRLLLLILPQSLVLERSARLLEKIMPGPYYTALTAQTTWRGQKLQLSAAYFPSDLTADG